MAERRMAQCRPVRPENPERQVVDYREDFDFGLDLRGCEGVALAVPGCDFTLALYVRGRARRYVVGRRDGELRGCYVDDAGLLHVVADAHGLPPGELCCLLTLYVPDGRYPDGVREVPVEFDPGIELMAGGVCPCHGVALRPMVAELPLVGMTEITAEEVDGLFDSLGGDEFGEPLRAATPEEIGLLFEDSDCYDGKCE